MKHLPAYICFIEMHLIFTHILAKSLIEDLLFLNNLLLGYLIIWTLGAFTLFSYHIEFTDFSIYSMKFLSNKNTDDKNNAFCGGK